MMIRQDRQSSNAHCYRVLPQPRRPAQGEPGTLSQQIAAIAIYLDAQADERRTGAAADRLWTICHALATEQPIAISNTTNNDPRRF